MKIYSNYPVQATSFSGIPENNATEQKVDFDMPNDTFELSSKNTSSRTTEEKQEILQKARTKAAGWSMLTGPIGTLYYGLRSDNKVAEKYNLNPKEDKDLIRKIKNQQMLCTVPAIIPGIGIVPGLVCWLYNKNMDPSKINV